MEQTNGVPIKKRRAVGWKKILLRILSAALLASLGVTLVLWDQGVFPLPFFGWRLTERERAPKPDDATVEVTDYEAYRAAVIRSLFPFEDVDGGYLLISPDRFDYGTMTMAVASLSDRERTVGGKVKMRVAAGILEILSPEGASYFLPAEGIAVTDSSRAVATSERDHDGKLLFSTENGYAKWSYAENGLVSSDWNELSARHLPFPAPLDWFDEEDAPHLFRDGETGLYGYARTVRDEEGRETEQTVVEAAFVTAYPYNEGYAVAIDPNGRERVFDLNGEEPFRGRTLLAFEGEGDGILGYPYVQDGVLRVIESSVNAQGEETVRPAVLRMDGTPVTLPPGFEVVSYSEGIFLLSNGDNVGYYSLEGKWVADPVYLNGAAFAEGLAVVQNADGMYGVIDAKGHEQIPCAFSYVSSFSDGTAVLYSDETGWMIVYKIRGVFGERGEDAPPVVTDRPFVTRIPVSRNSESGRDEDEIFIFPTVIPPRRTTVPEWTQRPRPTVTGPQAPDPTEPETNAATAEPSGPTPPAAQQPDPTERGSAL